MTGGVTGKVDQGVRISGPDWFSRTIPAEGGHLQKDRGSAGVAQGYAQG